MRQKSKAERFHVYTDGSLFTSKHLMGAGWIICRESNGKYLPGMKRVDIAGTLTSSVAEMYAVTLALHKVSEAFHDHFKRAVIVHSDDLALCNLLNKPDFKDHVDDICKKEFGKKSVKADALCSLFKAVSLHKSVTAQHEKAKNSDHLTRAHHLSRAACSLEKSVHQPDLL